MALDLVARHCQSDSADTRNLYEVLEDEDGLSFDVWVRKGERPTSMDIHIEFEEGD